MIRMLFKTDQITAIVEKAGAPNINGWPRVKFIKIFRNRSTASNAGLLALYPSYVDPDAIVCFLEDPNVLIKDVL